MKSIILYPEQNNLKPLQIVVREKDYKDLKKMQYSGGFKRFGLSVIDDKIKGKYKDWEKLGEYLGKIFLNTPTNSQTLKN